MRKLLVPLSQNPWILWGCFAAGFVLPHAFVLFLLLGAAAGWKGLKKEYAGVGRYWHEKSAEAVEGARLPPPLAPCRGGTLSWQMV